MLTLILSFFCFPLFGINASAIELNLEQITKELQRVPRVESLQGQFKQNKKLMEFDLNLSTEGEFEVFQSFDKTSDRSAPSPTPEKKLPETSLKPDFFVLHWRIKRPEITEVCIDKESIVLSEVDLKGNQKKKRVTISMISASSPSLLFLFKLFKLDPKDLNENFKIYKLHSNSFSLIPRDATKNPFAHIHLNFNSLGFVEIIEITEKNKDTLTIEFSNLKGEKSKFKTRPPAC